LAAFANGSSRLICNLLEQVQKAHCISENQKITKETCKNDPCFLDLSQFFILLLDLFDPYNHLNHIEGDCIYHINQQYGEYPYYEGLALLRRSQESSETSISILDL
jgi:hypothetical protein